MTRNLPITEFSSASAESLASLLLPLWVGEKGTGCLVGCPAGSIPLTAKVCSAF